MSDFCDHNTSTKLLGETTCDGCIACVKFFLHETSLLLVSLFYGKCYVTMFIRELSCSPIAIGENFFLKWEEIVSNHFFSSKTSVFCFLFPSFLNRFFFERFFPLHFIFFFGSSMTWWILLVMRFTFFFIVMKRHNRFFLIGDFCFIPAGHSQTMGWLHKLHELPS